MMLDEFVAVLRAFEETHGGREALSPLKIYTYINGKREPLRVHLKITGLSGVIIGGVRYLTSSPKDYHVELELWLIRFGRPWETPWGDVWEDVESLFSESYFGGYSREEASQVIPVNVSINYDREGFIGGVCITREPFAPLDGLEVRMGEESIEMHFSYDRPKERERVRIW